MPTNELGSLTGDNYMFVHPNRKTIKNAYCIYIWQCPTYLQHFDELFTNHDDDSQKFSCHPKFEQNVSDMEINVLHNIWQPKDKTEQKDIPKVPQIVPLLVAQVTHKFGTSQSSGLHYVNPLRCKC